MSFSNPLMLWAVTLGIIPIIIHLWSRQRYRIMPWGAVDFLLSAVKQQSIKVRIQDLVLLILRVSALVLAALVLARPVITTSHAELPKISSPGLDMVIVLDISYSMGTSIDGKTRLFAARQRAHTLLNSAPHDARIGVVYMDKRATRATGTLTTKRTHIADAIDKVFISSGTIELAPAMAAALDMLKDSTSDAACVCIITDAQRRTFADPTGALTGLLAGADPSIKFSVIIVPNAPTPNLAVTDLKITSRRLSVHAPISFEAQIRDFGTPATARADIELWVDGRKVSRQSITLADRRATTTFEHTFIKPGFHAIEVRLDPDAVEIDNHRYLALYIPESIEVALVTSDTIEDPYKSAYVYLEAALSASSNPDDHVGNRLYTLHQPVTPEHILENLKEQLSVVILPDPGRLPEESVEQLEAFIRRGGSLLITAGPKLATTLRSAPIAERLGLSELNITCVKPNQTDKEIAWQFDPSETLTAGAEPTVIDLDSPGMREAISAVTVFQTLTIEPRNKSNWLVVLRLGDGRPALLTRDLFPECPGRIALLTTALDADWCDSIYRPAFVPMLHDIISWLSRPRWVSPTLESTQGWSLAFPMDLSGLQLETPDGRRLQASSFLHPQQTSSQSVFQFDRIGSPGIYRLVDPTTPPHRWLDAGHALAVNIDPAESDQTVCSFEQLQRLFPRGRCEVIPPDASLGDKFSANLPGTELWPILAAALIGTLLLETLSAYYFSTRQQSGYGRGVRA